MEPWFPFMLPWLLSLIALRHGVVPCDRVCELWSFIGWLFPCMSVGVVGLTAMGHTTEAQLCSYPRQMMETRQSHKRSKDHWGNLGGRGFVWFWRRNYQATQCFFSWTLCCVFLPDFFDSESWIPAFGKMQDQIRAEVTEYHVWSCGTNMLQVTLITMQDLGRK